MRIVVPLAVAGLVVCPICWGAGREGPALSVLRAQADEGGRSSPGTTDTTAETGGPGEGPRWSGVVLKVEFRFPERRKIYSGTGFVLRDQTEQDYLITCAHLIRKQDWENRYSVKMYSMNRRIMIETFGPSLHVGPAVDLRRPRGQGWPDMTTDLVIRTVSGNWTQPLRLAKTGPQIGETIWAVGREPGEPAGDEKLFGGRVVSVLDGEYLMEKQTAFNPHGFSGGPVVNARGEVVGNVVAGAGNMVGGATASTLRQRLAEHDIQID